MTRDWLKEYAFEIEEFSHPWSVQVHAVDLYGWTEGWWPSEDSIRLVVGREGLPNMPLMKFRPAFPQSVLKPFCDLRGIRPALQTALHEVLSTCCTSKGKGRGKGKDADDAKDQRPFSEAISLFKAKLEAKLSQIALTQEKEVKSLEPYLDKLEQTEPPESIDYDLQTRFETCFHTWETDFVFGLGRTSVEIWDANTLQILACNAIYIMLHDAAICCTWDEISSALQLFEVHTGSCKSSEHQAFRLALSSHAASAST